MRWMYVILAITSISLIVTPSFAQSTSTYNVSDPLSGNTYPVSYNLTGGSVKNMSIDTNATSLVVALQMTGDGNFTIDLPRNVIDAKMNGNDDQFFVLVDGADTNFQETKTNTDRTLSIPVIDGSEKIEIIGTQVVPEFGPLSYVVLMISIISIIVLSKKINMHPLSK